MTEVTDSPPMTPPAEGTGDAQRLRQSIGMTLSFVAVLWVIQLSADLLDIDLARFGIYPRRIVGLIGIAFAPLVHASFTHLFANSLPIVILGTALLYGYPRSARWVIGGLYAGTGLGVWLFGRASHHIGASGLAFGMMFFVFSIGAIRWDRRAIALSMLVFFLYGSMVWGIFPTEADISFESHFFGALLGVILAFLFRDRDPPPPEKRYSWEGVEEPEAEEAPEEQLEAGPPSGEPEEEPAQGGPEPAAPR